MTLGNHEGTKSTKANYPEDSSWIFVFFVAKKASTAIGPYQLTIGPWGVST